MAIYDPNYKLRSLLDHVRDGELQLPEFQRSWVWDEDRIKSLVSSVSQAFPIGAIMTLETGGAVRFKERLIEGAPGSHGVTASHVVLDGQQRITSLYQACYRNAVVVTVTARKKKVERWFYINIMDAMNRDLDREHAIVGVPKDRILWSNFRRTVDLDLSSDEQEYRNRMFPLWRVFDSGAWARGYRQYWYQERGADASFQESERFEEFKLRVLDNITAYFIPTITLPKSTRREAVCLLFEKVNTAGKSLDAFELVTAAYAAEGFDLRLDWLGDGGRHGRHRALTTYGRAAGQRFGLLKDVSSKHFLQAVCLVATHQRRMNDLSTGKTERDATPVSATRSALLRMPLSDYRRYADSVQAGFEAAAKFLQKLHIFRSLDIPYQSQLIPLAAILAEVGSDADSVRRFSQLATWYWCGVFGELYGSAAETRFARDVVEVPAWLRGEAAQEPSTIGDAVFREDRLPQLRTRQSAAYKGMNALLMGHGTIRDWRTGDSYDLMTFYDESVDIHHIFPTAWCKKAKIDVKKMNSIVNKTPLSSKTNRILRGDAPTVYLRRLQAEPHRVSIDSLSELVESHQVSIRHLRTDDFGLFFSERTRRMLELIEGAMGKAVFREQATNEPEGDVSDVEAEDA